MEEETTEVNNNRSNLYLDAWIVGIILFALSLIADSNIAGLVLSATLLLSGSMFYVGDIIVARLDKMANLNITASEDE